MNKNKTTSKRKVLDSIACEVIMSISGDFIGNEVKGNPELSVIMALFYISISQDILDGKVEYDKYILPVIKEIERFQEKEECLFEFYNIIISRFIDECCDE
jgi:hypothetical protein